MTQYTGPHDLAGEDRVSAMDLMRDVDEAEMILVGIGSEFDGYGIEKSTENSIENREAYRNSDSALKIPEMLENTEYAWLIPAYRDYLTNDRKEIAGENRVRTALEKLRKLLEGKNYFIISQAQNGEIPRINWREGRLVMPCGSVLKKQCAQNCGTDKEEEGESCFSLTREEQDVLYECCGCLGDWLEGEGRESLSDEVLRALRMIGKAPKTDAVTQKLRERIPEDLLGRCPRCGAGMVLNVVQAAHYDEKGYLGGWQRYTKWLQGSVNRKLLVLELGVGMQYPGMIRIPFERVTLLNQKSKMYRIHENLYQVPDDFGKKGVGIAENTIDWLNNL